MKLKFRLIRKSVIEPVLVTRETEHTRWIITRQGREEREKIGGHFTARYFDTLDEAREASEKSIKYHIEVLEQKISDYNQDLEEIAMLDESELIRRMEADFSPEVRERYLKSFKS